MRKPREISSTGLYHIVNRGVGRQIIFEDQEDYEKFLRIIKKVSGNFEVSILAYCLMNNHFHFVLFDKRMELSHFMQKIQEKYAKYYNQKYLRSGYVFQGRFFSECIDDEINLWEAILYVHENPQKANICMATDYVYSSCGFYSMNKDDEILDIKMVRSLVENITAIGCRFNNDSNTYSNTYSSFHEFTKKSITDEDGSSYIFNVLHLNNGREIRDFPRNERDKYIIKLKNYGLSIRQIERLTGVGRGIIQRLCAEKRM